MSLFLCFCLSVHLCLSVSLSPCICLSVSLFLLSVSVSLSLPLSLCLCQSVFPSLAICPCLSVIVFLYFSVSLPLSLYLSTPSLYLLYSIVLSRLWRREDWQSGQSGWQPLAIIHLEIRREQLASVVRIYPSSVPSKYVTIRKIPARGEGRGGGAKSKAMSNSKHQCRLRRIVEPLAKGRCFCSTWAIHVYTGRKGEIFL